MSARNLFKRVNTNRELNGDRLNLIPTVTSLARGLDMNRDTTMTKTNME